MENRNLSGIPGMIRTPNISHSSTGQVWPAGAGISVNSALPRINMTPDILLSQAPSLPPGVSGNTPVITQPVWSPFLVYPSLLSAYVGTPNILTYSQLNTSPINYPSAYMDTASYFILDGQNATPTSIMHTHVNPVDPADDVLVDPLLFNIHDDELAQNAEAVWLLNNLNESPDRLESQFSNMSTGRTRARRPQSNRVEPYAIPERFHGRPTSYPLPHLSFPLQTVVPSVSAAVVYPTPVSLPQQLVTGMPPPVPSFLFTSLENATSNIIANAHSTVTALGAHGPLAAQVERPSLAVLQGGLATALTDHSTHVPAVISGPTLIPPLSLHSDPLRTRNIWDQGFMPIHISATQNQPT